MFFFFFSSRRRHTRFSRDWSSDVCSSDLGHTGWYETPSKSLSVAMHPPICTSSENDGLKQKLSSPSRSPPSVHEPPSFLTAPQYSKWHRVCLLRDGNDRGATPARRTPRRRQEPHA